MPTGNAPKRLSRWELILLALAVVVCLVLAISGRGRHERQMYERFAERAAHIEAALNRYAADHDGRYPPDAVFTNRPRGLNDSYIHWDPTWFIDYDVQDNGHGGKTVCLEFCGPTGERQYFGLCTRPQVRQCCGKGEPVPGHANRIWVVREEAPIMPSPYKR